LARGQSLKRIGPLLAAIAALSVGAAQAQPPPAMATTPPKRIVSMFLCVDQYLIALADKDQVAALTRFARDPAMSSYAEQAQAYPISRATMEEVLALRPDMVFASRFRSKAAFAPLERRGVRIMELGDVSTFEEIVEQTRVVAAAVGHPERGEALVAEMRRKLAAVEARPKATGVAAYYQRRGYLTGTGTLVDEMMRRAGLQNLAGRLGLGSLTRMPLEAMVKARPDYLILEADAQAQPDNGTALLSHPALRRLVPEERRLVVPQAATVCGGPFFPDAVEMLRSQALRAG
jgi:iron complex transport system substrate-binding protein